MGWTKDTSMKAETGVLSKKRLEFLRGKQADQKKRAYSALVVILQVQIRSGTMLTARKALEYGIPLGVLPGPPLSGFLDREFAIAL